MCLRNVYSREISVLMCACRWRVESCRKSYIRTLQFSSFFKTFWVRAFFYAFWWGLKNPIFSILTALLKEFRDTSLKSLTVRLSAYLISPLWWRWWWWVNSECIRMKSQCDCEYFLPLSSLIWVTQTISPQPKRNLKIKNRKKEWNAFNSEMNAAFVTVGYLLCMQTGNTAHNLINVLPHNFQALWTVFLSFWPESA